MPDHIRSFERRQRDSQQSLIILVTNKQYGDSIDDSIVVTRLGSYVQLLKAFIDKEPERYR